MIRHVSCPSLMTSPAFAGTKLIGISGIGIPLGRVGILWVVSLLTKVVRSRCVDQGCIS